MSRFLHFYADKDTFWQFKRLQSVPESCKVEKPWIACNIKCIMELQKVLAGEPEVCTEARGEYGETTVYKVNADKLFVGYLKVITDDYRTATLQVVLWDGRRLRRIC